MNKKNVSIFLLIISLAVISTSVNFTILKWKQLAPTGKNSIPFIFP